LKPPRAKVHTPGVHLDDDADTTGAVCGQLVGACWGESGIPGEWLEGLARRDRIEQALVGDRHEKCQRGGGEIGSAWLGVAPPRMAAVGEGYLALPISLGLVARVGLFG